MTEDETAEHSKGLRKGHLLAGVVTLGSAAALLWHDRTRTSPAPLGGAVPWLGLYAGIVLLWAWLRRTGRVLQAVACVVGGVGIAWLGEASWGAFFLVLVGLVILWEAIPLRAVEPTFFGGLVAVVGIVPMFPFWLVLGGYWLVLLGLALPFCVVIATTLARRFEARAMIERARTSRGQHT